MQEPRRARLAGSSGGGQRGSPRRGRGREAARVALGSRPSLPCDLTAALSEVRQDSLGRQVSTGGTMPVRSTV
eukprot:8136546-Pyramimonas_sp.AAC.1